MAISGVVDILVTYFTGTYAVLGMIIGIIFAFFLLVLTKDIRVSIITSVPVFGFFVAAGWFGSIMNAEWIVNLLLIVVAVFYGYAISKIL